MKFLLNSFKGSTSSICLKNLFLFTFFISTIFIATAQNVNIETFKITNESIQAAADGELDMKLSKPNLSIATIGYEYKGENNHQKTNEFIFSGDHLVIKNLQPGNYFNLHLNLFDGSKVPLLDKFQINYGKEQLNFQKTVNTLSPVIR